MNKPKAKKQTIEDGYEGYKKWLNNTFKKILDVMYIDYVNFDLQFDVDQMHDNKGMSGVFSINCDTNYHKALITVFPVAQKLFNTNKNRLIDAMVHELCHLHTNPLSVVAEKRFVSQSEFTDTCENLTEVMSVYVRDVIKLTTKDIYS
jgi:hypothetical protein